MTNRKVLLATYYFPPCGAVAVHRMLGLARYLPRFGWDPVIVAPPTARFEVEDPSLLNRVPPDTTVVRVPFPKGFLPKLQERFDPLSSWLSPAYAACKQVLRDHAIEAILTSGPPHCIQRLGMKLKRRTGLPWAICLRDPWHANRLEGHELPFPFRQIEARREAAAFSRADLIIANTPIMRNGIAAAYPDATDKTIVAPNGFDPEMFPRREHRPSPEKITLVHAGEIYFGRDPLPLLDALAEHKRSPVPGLPRIEMKFFGRNTIEGLDLDKEIRSRDLSDRVTNCGVVPYGEALEAMLAADMLVLLHTPGYRMSVPAKLYEYLGARRPILALAEPDGDIDWVLQTSGVPHRTASPTDAQAIRQSLFDLARQLVRDDFNLPSDDRLFRFSREGMASAVAAGLDWALAGGKLETLAGVGAVL
jgi:glycosyltransferase involved in cell wall biosynthesis